MSDAASLHPDLPGDRQTGASSPVRPEGAAGPVPAGPDTARPSSAGGAGPEAGPSGADGDAAAHRRRRGSRGGRNRSRAAGVRPGAETSDDGATAAGGGPARLTPPRPGREVDGDATPGGGHPVAVEPVAGPAPLVGAPLVPRPANGLPVAGTPTRPKIGDSRPAPPLPAGDPAAGGTPAGRPVAEGGGRSRRRRGSGRSRSLERGEPTTATVGVPAGTVRPAEGRGRPGGRGRTEGRAEPTERDAEAAERRRGRERKGRPVGRYLMVVHVQAGATQIAVLEGRNLIEHYVSRPSDDATQIDGNIYIGRVQNVLPGMEAAFVDIGTPKNAVLYRGDVRYDKDDLEGGEARADGKPTRGRLPGAARDARIEQLLKPGQTVLCQVTKNPIGAKGARLAQEVSIPGRFVVLIPNSDTYGISKRLPDDERKRLRRILDDVRPAGHGLIVRTAAEGADADELRRDVARLQSQWEHIDALARSSRAPRLLYREPDMAVRVIREEFNRDYRGVVIDDRELFEEVRDYVASISPELADRVEFAGDSDDPLPAFEKYHVHEQIHKALDRKVWLPSGGSLIIERTEALTVIDVNTGKNVGTSNLEETVFRNNLEAAEEIARQLRLRDIGGIIVIDFIDMEIVANRGVVVRTFREALARDKTRTQVFDISELGLVEMTRKRISEGLVESMSLTCPTCRGRGFVLDESLLAD